MKKNVLDAFREEILGIDAYAVEEPSGLIKLDANENPYPPPEWLTEALSRKCRSLQLNRYPDPDAHRLRGLVAERAGWTKEGVLLGNGSDELIGLLCTACGGPGARMVVPVPTFVMYRLIGLTSGWEVTEVPLTGEFDLDPDSFLDRVRARQPRLVTIAYPNNPTGNCFSEDRVRQVLEEAPSLVVVDEAYQEFSGKSFIHLLGDHPNLIILRTLSKLGLAALRLGILLASPELVRQLNKVRLPYNVSTFSQEAASTVLENPEFLKEQIGTILAERDGMTDGMKKMDGVTPFRSDSNFILFRTERDSREVFRGLQEEGVLVRDLGRPGLLENCLRVTIGTPPENRAFLDGLRKATARPD